MAITRYKEYYTQSWDYLHVNGSKDVGSNGTNVDRAVRNKSSLTKGQWITFSDGSRFRLPTTYGVSFAELIAVAGENTNGHNSSYTKMNWKTSPGGRTDPAFSSATIYVMEGMNGCNPIGVPNLITEEQNEAVTKCLNKLADQKVNIAENLATFSQTVRLFTNPTKAYLKGILTLRKWRIANKIPNYAYRDLIRFGYSRKLAEQYLAYVYGLVPLMQDLHGIAELAKEQGQKPMLLSALGKSHRDDSNGDIYYNDVSGSRDFWYKDLRCVSDHRCTLWAKLDDKYEGTRTINRLGLINPASLVWELVPYSFLVDWVLPIGPVLQALTAPAGLDFVAGSISRRATVSGLFTAQHRVSNMSGTPAVSTYRYDGYRRERLSTWPRPGLWIDRDPLRLASDGSDRVFKALALSILALPRR